MSRKFRFDSEDIVFVHWYNEIPTDITLHTHDISEIIYVKKGDISYMVEGKIFRPVKNSLIFTRPMENHAILFNSQLPYERYTLLFNEKKLVSDIYQHISPDTVLLHFESDTLILEIFKRMEYYYENFEGAQLQTLLMHLTEELLYNIVLASQNTNQSAVYTSDPVLQHALEYIEQHISTPLSLEMICSELFISKSHLHHLFVKHLKLSPQKYILTKRMAVAQRALRSGRKPTEVYTECGFSEYSTFFRAYRKYFGHAPSEEINTSIVREIPV